MKPYNRYLKCPEDATARHLQYFHADLPQLIEIGFTNIVSSVSTESMSSHLFDGVTATGRVIYSSISTFWIWILIFTEYVPIFHAKNSV